MLIKSKTTKTNFSLLNLLKRVNYIDIIVILLITLFSSWLMYQSFNYQNGQMIVASKAWSDFGAHIPLVRSFSLGHNLPVEYPHFAGEPITYHFLLFWVAGVLERIGLNIAHALNIPSIIGLAGLGSAIYLLTTKWFKSRSAGIISVLLLFFNGTLSFVKAITDNPREWSKLTDIFTEKHFVQFGPWNGDIVSAFWNLNIYTNQRHLALGFLLIFIFMLPLISQRFTTLSKPIKLSVYGFLITLAIITPLINQITIPLLGVLVFFWLLFFPQHYRLIPLYLLIAIVSIPAHAFLMQGSTHQIALSYGFLAPNTSLIEWAIYWLYNLGAYLVLLPVLLITSPKPVKSLLLSGLILFAITNTFQLSPDIINNHKLINLTLIFFNIATAGLIILLWRKHHFLKPLAVIIFITVTASGIIDFFPILNDSKHYINDLPRSDTASYIIQNTTPDSVFMVADKFYNPAGIAGRKMYFGYSYFTWSMGYDNYDREQISRQVFSPNINHSEVCRLLTDNQIDYVLISQGVGQIGETDVQQSIIRQSFTPKYKNDSEGQIIYQVQQNCDDKS